MNMHSHKLFLSVAVAIGLSGSAFAAEDVKFRYLASQGGLSAHELAAGRSAFARSFGAKPHRPSST